MEFPWFMVERDIDADAYCTFISMLCEFARIRAASSLVDTSTAIPSTPLVFPGFVWEWWEQEWAARRSFFGICPAIRIQKVGEMRCGFRVSLIWNSCSEKVPCRNKITAAFCMRNEKYPVLPGTVGEVTHIDDAGAHSYAVGKRFFPCSDSRNH